MIHLLGMSDFGGRIETHPDRRGLMVYLFDEGSDEARLILVIPYHDLLRATSLVQRVQSCPPGFEDLVTDG